MARVIPTAPPVRGASSAALVVLALGGAIPASLAAQEIRSPFRFVEETQSAGIVAGPIFTNPGPWELGPESGVGFGARYGIRLGGPFALEGTLGLLNTSRVVWDLPDNGGGPERLGEADMNLGVLDASLRFNVTGPRTWHHLMPYLAFGFGGITEIGTSGLPEVELEPEVEYRFGTSFAGNIGGGLEWFAGPRFTVRLDARNVLWPITTPPAFLEHDPVVAPRREWTQNFWLVLGGSYRF
jgi:hypothetical protein